MMCPRNRVNSSDIIDLPQAVDAAGNNHAQRMLLCDFFDQFAPEQLNTAYGPEIWTRYLAGLLTNDTVLRKIDDAQDEDAARRLRMAGS